MCKGIDSLFDHSQTPNASWNKHHAFFSLLFLSLLLFSFSILLFHSLFWNTQNYKLFNKLINQSPPFFPIYKLSFLFHIIHIHFFQSYLLSNLLCFFLFFFIKQIIFSNALFFFFLLNRYFYHIHVRMKRVNKYLFN